MGTYVFNFETGKETFLDDGEETVDELDSEPGHLQEPITPTPIRFAEEEPEEVEGQQEFVVSSDGERAIGLGEVDSIRDYGDRPEKVDNPKDPPFRSIGYMRMHWGNVGFRGSGVLISERHVLTCAHNLWQGDRLPDQGSFRPAQMSQFDWPYGRFRWKQAYVPDNYRNGSRTAGFDYAMVTLKDSPGGDLGYFKMLAADSDFLGSHQFDVTGYAYIGNVRNKFFMREDTGSIELIRPKFLGYKMSTREGTSGGPVWTIEAGEPLVVGVHNKSGRVHDPYNLGARLNENKIRRIKQWMAEP